MRVAEIRSESDFDRISTKPNGLPSTSVQLPTMVSATELYEGQLTRLQPVFEDLLWDGLTILVARPKAGKSWLTLQLGVHAAGGRPISGANNLQTGPVVYVALEEPAARTMARLRKVGEPGPWTKNLHFVYELLPLMGGGAEQLSACCEGLRPRVVILDTLTALIKGGGGHRETDVFRSQYAEVSRIRKLAEEHRCAIVLVHHQRKGGGDGPIESIAGTGGISAAVDCVWHMKRRPEGEATLDIVGREVEEATLAMRFEQEPFGWRLLGDDNCQALNGERRQLLELLKEDGALTPAQIAAGLGKSQPAVRMLLKRMRADNQVQKQGSKYAPLSLSELRSYGERENE